VNNTKACLFVSAKYDSCPEPCQGSESSHFFTRKIHAEKGLNFCHVTISRKKHTRPLVGIQRINRPSTSLSNFEQQTMCKSTALHHEKETSMGMWPNKETLNISI